MASSFLIWPLHVFDILSLYLHNPYNNNFFLFLLCDKVFMALSEFAFTDFTKLAENYKFIKYYRI